MSKTSSLTEKYNKAKKECKLPYVPKTEGQRRYLNAIKQNIVIFCTGIAGTGKTALATQQGYLGLLHGRYEKLIITRPVIGVGKTSGYLPGNSEEKIMPFLTPIYDELQKIASSEQELRAFRQEKAIEIAPLEFMRGRNFHKSFVVVDEAQNCRREELELLLTRLGEDSKMILVGDLSQSDLPIRDRGGIKYYADILSDLDDIEHIHLDESDVVRSAIVRKILIRLKEIKE